MMWPTNEATKKSTVPFKKCVSNNQNEKKETLPFFHTAEIPSQQIGITRDLQPQKSGSKFFYTQSNDDLPNLINELNECINEFQITIEKISDISIKSHLKDCPNTFFDTARRILNYINNNTTASRDLIIEHVQKDIIIVSNKKNFIESEDTNFLEKKLIKHEFTSILTCYTKILSYYDDNQDLTIQQSAGQTVQSNQQGKKLFFEAWQTPHNQLPASAINEDQKTDSINTILNSEVHQHIIEDIKNYFIQRGQKEGLNLFILSSAKDCIDLQAIELAIQYSNTMKDYYITSVFFDFLNLKEGYHRLHLDLDSKFSGKPSALEEAIKKLIEAKTKDKRLLIILFDVSHEDEDKFRATFNSPNHKIDVIVLSKKPFWNENEEIIEDLDEASQINFLSESIRNEGKIIDFTKKYLKDLLEIKLVNFYLQKITIESFVEEFKRTFDVLQSNELHQGYKNKTLETLLHNRCNNNMQEEDLLLLKFFVLFGSSLLPLSFFEGEYQTSIKNLVQLGLLLKIRDVIIIPGSIKTFFSDYILSKQNQLDVSSLASFLQAKFPESGGDSVAHCHSHFYIHYFEKFAQISAEKFSKLRSKELCRFFTQVGIYLIHEQRDFKKGEYFLKRAIKFVLKNDVNKAKPLIHLSYISFLLADYKSVLEYLNQADNFFKDPASSSKEIEELKDLSKNFLAITYKFQGKLNDSEMLMREVLATQQNNVMYLHNLALILKSQDKYEESIELINKAFEIQEKNDPKNAPMATILNSKGAILSFRGSRLGCKQDFEDAKSHIDKARTIRNNLFQDEPHHPDIAFSIDTKATLYFHKGLYKDAIRNYLIALKKFKLFFEKNNKNVHIGATYIGIAESYEMLDNLNEAKKYYEMAHSQLESFTLPTLYHARIFRNLARLEIKFKKSDPTKKYDLKKAKNYLEDAKRIYQNIYGASTHSDEAQCYEIEALLTFNVLQIVTCLNSAKNIYSRLSNQLKEQEIQFKIDQIEDKLKRAPFCEFRLEEKFVPEHYLNFASKCEQVKRYRECALNRLNLNQKEWLLEIGCGTGAFLKEVLNKYKNIQVTGIDINKNMIAICQKNDKLKRTVDFKVADVMNLPRVFSMASQFDVVFIDRVMQHIPQNNLYETLERIHSVCKSRIIICDTVFTQVDIKPESDISKKIVQCYRNDWVHSPDFAENVEWILEELNFEIIFSQVFDSECRTFEQVLKVGAFRELTFNKLKENQVLTEQEIQIWTNQIMEAEKKNELCLYAPIKVIEARKK